MSLKIKQPRRACLYGPDGIIANSVALPDKAGHIVNDLFAFDGRSLAVGGITVTSGDLLEVLLDAHTGKRLVRFGRKLKSSEIEAIESVLTYMLHNHIDELS